MKSLLLLALIAFTTSNLFSKETLGSSKAPVRCDSPSGERWYLSRLRIKTGDKLTWKRIGSFGGEGNSLLDGYKNNKGEMLFFNMYHYRYIEIKAPKGYRLLWEWSDNYEYVNGLLHLVKQDKPFTGKVEIKLDKSNIIGEIEKGLIKGKFTHYYKNGKAKRVSNYAANRLEGKEFWYREDGKLWAFYHYKKGVLNGLYRYYDESGKLEKEQNYLNGFIVDKK